MWRVHRLSLWVCFAALVALTGCSQDAADRAPAAPSAVSSPGASTPARPSTAAGEPSARSVEGDVRGARVRLDVDSVTRGGDTTLLRARLTVLAGELNPVDDFSVRGGGSDRTALSDVRLVVPEQDLLASPSLDAEGEPVTTRLGRVELAPGQTAGLEVVYGDLPPEVERTDVLWPLLGVVRDVPVTEDAPAELARYGSEAPRPAEGEPVTDAVAPLHGRTGELAGAVQTEQQAGRTRVVVASDVLFALDSDQLEPDSQQALERAARQVAATGSGPVQVVGHTDDQGAEEYNADLSRRRAQTVASVLAAQLPPDRFPAAMEGRGELEPAVEGTSEQARAANRRVELTVDREQQPVTSTGTAQLASGPQADAAEGLLLPSGDGALRLTAERAVRTGDWLRVELLAVAEQSPSGQVPFGVDLRADRSTAVSDASGVGVLDGDRVLLAGVAEDGSCACPNVLFGVDLVQGEQRPVPVYVRAPAGTPAQVDVELPDRLGRLTGVPVTG